MNWRFFSTAIEIGNAPTIRSIITNETETASMREREMRWTDQEERRGTMEGGEDNYKGYVY